MKTFTVNKKVYTSQVFDLNMVCDFEEDGISLDDMRKMPLSAVRKYFGVCSGLNAEAAGAEIQNHILAGGDFNDLFQAFSDAMEESDFFRALQKKAEADASDGESQETKKKKQEKNIKACVR